MRFVCLIVAASVLHAWAPGALAGSDELTRESIAAELSKRIPSKGTLRLEYETIDPDVVPGRLFLFMNFETGAWTLIRPRPNTTIGREASGAIFEGTPHAALEQHGKPFTRREKVYSGFDFFLDEYLPLITLRDLLRMERAFVGAERRETGEMVVRFTLPRGSRAFTLEELHEVEIERWGGREKIFKLVTFVVSPDWMVMRIEKEGEGEEEIRTAPCSRPGVQVAEQAIGISYRLVACAFDGVDPGLFSMDGAKTMAEKVLPAPSVRSPVPKATDPEPIPMRVAEGGGWGSMVLRGQTLTIAGAALVVLGLAAWYRSRSGGSR